jgi:hypothetical protein
MLALPDPGASRPESPPLEPRAATQAGIPVKFRQYARESDRKSDSSAAGPKAGRERAGSIWSSAPGGVWIVPAEREPGDPSTCLFGHAGRNGTYWVIESEQSR